MDPSSTSAAGTAGGAGAAGSSTSTTCGCCFVRHPTNDKRYVYQRCTSGGGGNSSSDNKDDGPPAGVIHYEWEQKLDEVVIYVKPPPGVPGVIKASMVDCKILPRRIRLKLKNGDAQNTLIDEDTFGTVDVEESTWTLEDIGIEKWIVIYLCKANLGVVWESVFKSEDNTKGGCGCPKLEPMQLEQVKQQLMRERWTQENPGMDFSDAAFNGEAPDPRTFMGGATY